LSEKGPAIDDTRGLLRGLEIIWLSEVESTRFLTPKVALTEETSMISILKDVDALAHCVAHKMEDKMEKK
jgi:hypothetical protein